MSAAVVARLRAGMTVGGEVIHACWVTSGDAMFTPPSLCHRYPLTNLRPPPGLTPWSQVTCVACVRVLAAADRAATAVAEHPDVYAQCNTCRGWGWLPPADPGDNDAWACWSCRARREERAAQRHQDRASAAAWQALDDCEALDAAEDEADADG